MNLSKSIKITRVNNDVSAGTSDVETAVIDMQNFEGCLFQVLFGAITSGAVTAIKAQQGNQADLSDAVDLPNTNVAVADTDNDKLFWLDIFRPTKRFIRLVVERGTANATIDGVVAMQYGPRVKPTVHDVATVGGGEVHAGPAE